VPHFRPLHDSRSSQSLEVTLGELIPSEQHPLLKKRRMLTREKAIKLWAQKRDGGWQSCVPQKADLLINAQWRDAIPTHGCVISSVS
jgi:hypothetical protein